MRDWTDDERGRLDGYLEQARLASDAKRMMMRPGVPALISLDNGGDRRRKRKIAWAVVAEGEQPRDREKLRVCCGGGGGDGGDDGDDGDGARNRNEVLEVSLDEVQPVQVRDCER